MISIVLSIIAYALLIHPLGFHLMTFLDGVCLLEDWGNEIEKCDAHFLDHHSCCLPHF
jgi:hypothetical protein